MAPIQHIFGRAFAHNSHLIRPFGARFLSQVPSVQRFGMGQQNKQSFGEMPRSMYLHQPTVNNTLLTNFANRVGVYTNAASGSNQRK